ncbi:hypothetical protein MED01_002372 [Micromonospora sp. MED01]|uniref:hypothetical protein n=1 Tax=Micromonospora alfalfae TaxID=2911212 RepID=UPI001EE90202|nr:hypothetical protein [Micromonospora alfalfae]MCG5464207.1 hypothetical protein [Micromonospora alfalfae]
MNDLTAWLDQQLENQRHTAEALKTLAAALPAETATLLTETASLLRADVGAKRRILDEIVPLIDRLDADLQAELPGGRHESTGQSDELICLLVMSYVNPPTPQQLDADGHATSCGSWRTP